MTPRDVEAFINGVCAHAKKAGVGLDLTATDDGHRWQWSNGATGTTTAHTKPVAFYHACADYMDHHNIKQGFNQ